MNDIVRSEYKSKIYPTRTVNFNAMNKKIEFMIDYGDTFSMGRYHVFIPMLFLKKSDETNFPAGSNIKFVENFVPYLLSKMEVKKHNHLILEVDQPETTSMVGIIVLHNLLVVVKNIF